MWKHMCSHTCGPQSQRLALPARSHESISLGQGHCSVKPSPLHPNAEAVTVLAHIFAEIEGLTNTRQCTHRKPPLSSSTPSQDPATCSTSLRSPSRLRSWALHLHTTTVRTLATPQQQGEFTSWEDALGLQTELPHIAPIRELSVPQHTPAERILQPMVAKNRGDIFPRLADDLRTSLTDGSVLARRVAQKPEPGSSVKSATGMDMAPSRHWHPTIPEHACVVSDAIPSLVSFIVAIWSAGCSLLPRLLSHYHHHGQTPSPFLRPFLSSSATQMR